MQRLKKGDEVIVTAGKDKSQRQDYVGANQWPCRR